MEIEKVLKDKMKNEQKNSKKNQILLISNESAVRFTFDFIPND